MGLQRVRHNLATEQQQQMSNKFHFYPQYFIFNDKILKNIWKNVNNFRWWEYGCVVLSLTCLLKNFFKNEKKNTHDTFHRTRTNNPKIYMEPQKTQNCQGNLEKK